MKTKISRQRFEKPTKKKTKKTRNKAFQPFRRLQTVAEWGLSSDPAAQTFPQQHLDRLYNWLATKKLKTQARLFAAKEHTTKTNLSRPHQQQQPNENKKLRRRKTNKHENNCVAQNL
jgi:hypothetical protein